jgi:hypothetical protein
MFLWNLKWLKFDLIFINPCELQIIFFFNFFILIFFVYEISKKTIIHMDFIKQFSKYYELKKLHPSKQLMSSSFYLSFKMEYMNVHKCMNINL